MNRAEVDKLSENIWIAYIRGVTPEGQGILVERVTAGYSVENGGFWPVLESALADAKRIAAQTWPIVDLGKCQVVDGDYNVPVEFPDGTVVHLRVPVNRDGIYGLRSEVYYLNLVTEGHYY